MKILTLVWSVGPGGTERAAVNYAIGYKMYGHHSRVLVLGEGDDRLKDLEAAGVDTCMLVKNTGKEKEIIGAIKEWGADIIHIHNFSAALVDYTRQLKTGKTKIVETNVFSRPVYDPLYSTVDLSLQLTSWGYWRYLRKMKAAPAVPAVAVIPYIIDAKKFTKPAAAAIAACRQQLQIPADAFVAGRIGQAHPSKWHEGLIDIINATIQPSNNIYYILAGLSSNKKLLFDKQTDFFKSRVKLVDRIDGDDNLSLYYHCIDCFVHWSAIGESFGYVLTEAMHCGVPVVTMVTPFNDNGQFEVVGHYKGGICAVDKNDFIKSILSFYNNPLLLQQIKTEIKNDWIKKRFSFEAVMPLLLSMYTSILENKRPAANFYAASIQDFFSFYATDKPLKAMLVKLVNTAFCYQLVQWAKNKAR